MAKYEKIGHYAFMAVIVIAVIAGVAVGYMADKAALHWGDPSVTPVSGGVTLVMLVLGIIVGLVTFVTVKDVGPFLIAAIALMATGLGNLPNFSGPSVWSPLSKVHSVLPYLATGVLSYLVAFATPVAVLLAMKSIWDLTRTK
jgi:hypothetical protein